MVTMYIYRVIREYPDGSRGKRAKRIYRYEPNLEIGGLYVRLREGCSGMQRVLDMETEEFPD